jgi:hypothetical protein
LHQQWAEQRVPQTQPQQSEHIQWRATNWQVALVDRGFQDALVIGHGGGSAANYQQTQVARLPTPTEQAGELQYSTLQERFDRETGRILALRELDQLYVFEDRSEVAYFIERNRLRELLLDAGEPLNAAFGKELLKKLTLATDDEGCTTLFCLVHVHGEMQEARRALRSFDHQWWLHHLTQAAGKLNFDFELV